MAMTNFRDLSTGTSDLNAGFQFEFFCELTGESWKSPFKKYTRGRLNGWLSRATTIFYQFYSVDRVASYAAEAGVRKAKAAALADAMEMAADRFRQCEKCNKWVSLAVYEEDRGRCKNCLGTLHASGSSRGAFGNYADDDSSGPVCPNCQTPSQGGRFCHECGFDMASTHKSCPSCGATMSRQTRFCTDCGHAF